MKHLDLRVQKTYTALFASLTKLIQTKDFEDISVTEICDGALIRRQTFYKHFLDKYDFLTFFIKKRINAIFESAFDNVGVDNDDNFFTLVFKQLIQELDDVILLIFKLQMSGDIINELENIQDYGKAMLSSFTDVDETTDPKFFDYKRHIMMGMTINSVNWYRNNKHHLTQDEMMTFHKNLMKSLA